MFDDMMTNLDLSSSSFYSDDEYNSDRINNTRVVWITNYKTDVDFPIHVSIDHSNSPLTSNTSETDTLLHHIQTIDLSKLNLDDLLILLYRLQQKTTKHPIINSPSSSASQDRQRFSNRPIHCQSSFTLSNIADAPKHLTTTLAKSISSIHSSSSPRHIHSPNDVVNKLLQSYHQRPPQCTYQQCQQHKANLISRLLAFKTNN